MKKKFFLTSMMLFSATLVTFGIEKPGNDAVAYSLGEKTVVNAGTITEEYNFSSTPTKTGNTYYVYFTHKTVNSDIKNQFSLVPETVNGTNANLENWSENFQNYNDGGIGIDIKQTYLVSLATLSNGDKQLSIKDESLYSQYKEILTIIANKYNDEFDGEGYNLIKLGSEISGITKDEKNYLIHDRIYYVCDCELGEYSNVYPILGILGTKTTDIQYKDCSDDYKTIVIPNNFITSTVYSLTIPNSVTSIEDEAFANASKLTSITSNTLSFIVETEADGTQYLFEVDNSDNKTLVFATASTKVTVLDWDDTYVGIKDNALKFRSNLTINTVNPISYTSAKGANTVVQKKASTKPASYDFSTGDYTVTESINASDMAGIINNAITYNCTYVDMTGADVTEDLDIDAICEANSKDFSNLNTIFFFPASTHNVTGKNVVVDGNCANLVLTEAADFFSPYDFHAANVTYNRTISTNWSTISLPFDVNGANATTLKATCNFGDLYSYSAVNNEFTFAIKDVMTAYTPYIIQSSSDVIDPTFSNVDVAATTGHVENSMERNGASFCSTMSRKQLTATNETSYFFFKDNLVYAVNKGTVKPFRCFMSAPAQPAAAGSLRIIDAAGNEMEVLELDNTTYIETISKDVKNDVTYNLNGQKVENNNGLMVKKGSKMIIK